MSKKQNKRVLGILFGITLVLSGLIFPTMQVQAETTKQLGTSMITDPMVPNKNTRQTDYASAPVELKLWEAPTVKTMNFGTKGIVGPAAPNNPRDAWKGCYVYFGKYNGSPVKYRVLDADTTYYSADKMTQTMLLDCDSVLYVGSFTTPPNNTWKGSYTYNSLNGTDFLDKEGVFTNTEKNAIAASTVGSHKLTTDSETGANVTSGIQTSFKKYIALTGEKIFLLDAEDVSNGAYGYTMTSHDYRNENRMKTGSSVSAWFLRSAYSYSQFGIVTSDGYINSGLLTNNTIGLSPALNLNLSSVLFSSASAVSKTSALTSESAKIGTTSKTDWKLTLKDSGKSVALTEGRSVTKSSDGTITVPYTYTDSATTELDRVNQISVMITDKTYGNESAQILYYGALSNIKNAEGKDSTVAKSATGSGTFTLPSSLTGTMGENYHIYLLAEHVSDGNSTDYAGEPLEIKTVLNEVDTVTLTDIKVPTPEQPLNNTKSISSTGTSDTATIVWKKGEKEVTGNAEWKTTYKAYVKLTPANGYTFMDAAGQIAGVTVTGKQEASKNVTWNADGTLTVYFGEYTTATRKIKSVLAPQAPKQFASDYTAQNVLSSKEFGTTAKVTLEGTSQPNSKDMEVQWSVVDAGGNVVAYDASSAAYNTFKWRIKSSEYTQYDVNNVGMEGTVSIQNRRDIPGVTTLPTVAERTYHPTKVLVNSDIKGGVVKSRSGNVVAGTWSWKEQNVVPSVDKKEYEVIFTPADTKYYEPIAKTIEVNVKKATPVITTNPTASGITNGKTLKSSVLSGGKAQLDKVNVKGTFCWKDTTVKPSMKDSGVTKYTVVFTPADAVNYNTAESKVTIVINLPAKGATDVSDNGKATYKITKSDLKKGTVTYVAPTNKKATTVSVPATVKIDGVTYKVTSIAKNAFKNNKSIKSVTIGKNIKTIDKCAFYKCTKLKTVKFGKNVTTIGDKAFYKCTALTKITLPSKVKKIGKSAFYGCKKVKYITIGTSVSKIGSKAFYGCSKVKTLTVKSTKLTTKKIGSKAFSKMSKSMKVKIPKKKFKTYKSMLMKRGVNKKAKFKKS